MNSSLETFVPLQFKRKKGKLLVDGREGVHDVRIIEAVARAMHWHALLDTGAFKSVDSARCLNDSGRRRNDQQETLWQADRSPDYP